MNFNCESCGKRMNLMRVSPDGITWRDAFVCTGPKIGCGIKELDDILPTWEQVSRQIEKADSDWCESLEQNSAPPGNVAELKKEETNANVY